MDRGARNQRAGKDEVPVFLPLLQSGDEAQWTFHRAGETHEHFPPIRSVYTVDSSDLGCERSCRDTLGTPLWRPPVWRPFEFISLFLTSPERQGGFDEPISLMRKGHVTEMGICDSLALYQPRTVSRLKAGRLCFRSLPPQQHSRASRPPQPGREHQKAERGRELAGTDGLRHSLGQRGQRKWKLTA